MFADEAASAAGELLGFHTSADKTDGFIRRSHYTQYLIRFSLAVSKTLAFLALKLR